MPNRKFDFEPLRDAFGRFARRAGDGVADGQRRNRDNNDENHGALTSTDESLGATVPGASSPTSTDVPDARSTPPTSVTVDGQTIPVHQGGPGTPTDNGLGMQYPIDPTGTPLDSRVASVRVMDPRPTGRYPQPTGYVSYANGGGQTVNPFNGQTIGKDNPLWHIPL